MHRQLCLPVHAVDGLRYSAAAVSGLPEQGEFVRILPGLRAADSSPRRCHRLIEPGGVAFLRKGRRLNVRTMLESKSGVGRNDLYAQAAVIHGDAVSDLFTVEVRVAPPPDLPQSLFAI